MKLRRGNQRLIVHRSTEKPEQFRTAFTFSKLLFVEKRSLLETEAERVIKKEVTAAATVLFGRKIAEVADK